MGGDHKCPVCQATFTRPQHVARHMRSHTGDRPYKCQYCGDQFARSDLLSRHVNKCHANEKPASNATSGSRRKGPASASRATTSKQACDQCVQSSLPCDGCNPCSKCVSRKCRCTYVKFHRQTAPSGPGHNPRPTSASPSLGGSVAGASHLDDFMLVPPSTVPSMGSSLSGADDRFNNVPFMFNPGAPAYPPNATSADMAQLSLSMASDAEFVGKYRAHAELLRPAGPSMLSTAPGMLPNLYGQHHPHGQPPPSNWYGAWGESGGYHPMDDTKSFDGLARVHSFASTEAPSFAPDLYGTGLIGSPYRPRRGSLDFSDSSSATSQSVPSSAASSNVHLPLPGGNEMYDNHSDDMRRHGNNPQMSHQRRDSVPTSQPPTYTSSAPGHPHQSQQHSQHSQQHQTQGTGEGGFSSAFGLMSIDDPNVLAGLSSDGVPFFSNVAMDLAPHSPNATPMPTRVQQQLQQGRDRGVSLSALPTPGGNKEADTRELKDFWKAYMRTPSSGPGPVTLDALSTSNVPLSQSQMPQSPSSQRRRVRVSSLPSVTPTMERVHPMVVNGHGGHGEASGMRTTLHGNPDDLRSYEAAVNARSAALKLNLVPRRKVTRPSSSASPPVHFDGGPSSGSAVGGSQMDQQGGISRPSSSSSVSSLAHAFGVPTHHHPHPPVPNIVKPPPMQGASISLPIPSVSSGSSSSLSNSHTVTFGPSSSITFGPGSRESSVGSDGTGGSNSDGEMVRPSFKRLPSQTLGPTSSKRVLVSREVGKGVGGDMVGVKVENGVGQAVGSGSSSHTGPGASDGRGMGNGAVNTGSRTIAALPERARRASEASMCD
ncbi:hypothetical protein BDN67DRAFT_967868 [Paxillus ammoniavirescens]|nr:hypothetical protein BDN67DRAFT_967868 [Paxillus ammoniavirescens]